MVLKGSGLQSRCFPSRAFLIETKIGPVLWDTGYAARFADAVSYGVYRAYGLVTPVEFNESDSLVKQLARAGLNRADMKHVVMSHFHADHIAGLKDFPAAIIYACAHGWHFHKNLGGIGAVRRAFLPDLMPATMSSQLAYVQQLPEKPLPAALFPFRTGYDLTGTDEVFIVELPGHAVGHLGAFVKTDAGWTLIASDASWTAEGYRELRGPSELTFLVQHSRSLYYESLRKIHLLHRGGAVSVELTHEEPDTAASLQKDVA